MLESNSISLEMARSSKAAMLAAVELYNKTAFEYREEAFCVLIVNAWEVLLKARIVSRNNDEIETIFLRDSTGNISRSSLTNSPLTISLDRALNECDAPSAVKKNVQTLSGVRNEITHLGPLHPDLRQKISQFGTASVANLSTLLQRWFNEPIEGTYLLPVGFIGNAVGVVADPSRRQNQLLRDLQSIASNSEDEDEDFSVALSVRIEIARASGGGGTIGISSDPNAPRVTISDDELLELYPDTFDDMVEACGNRYQDFKRNADFNHHLRTMKADPEIAKQRHLNPSRPSSASQWFYNVAKVFDHLDEVYSVRGD